MLKKLKFKLTNVDSNKEKKKQKYNGHYTINSSS